MSAIAAASAAANQQSSVSALTFNASQFTRTNATHHILRTKVGKENERQGVQQGSVINKVITVASVQRPNQQRTNEPFTDILQHTANGTRTVEMKKKVRKGKACRRSAQVRVRDALAEIGSARAQKPPSGPHH
jgi:hypothetical protein